LSCESVEGFWLEKFVMGTREQEYSKLKKKEERKREYQAFKYSSIAPWQHLHITLIARQ